MASSTVRTTTPSLQGLAAAGSAPPLSSYPIDSAPAAGCGLPMPPCGRMRPFPVSLPPDPAAPYRLLMEGRGFCCGARSRALDLAGLEMCRPAISWFFRSSVSKASKILNAQLSLRLLMGGLSAGARWTAETMRQDHSQEEKSCVLMGSPCTSFERTSTKCSSPTLSILMSSGASDKLTKVRVKILEKGEFQVSGKEREQQAAVRDRRSTPGRPSKQRRRSIARREPCKTTGNVRVGDHRPLLEWVSSNKLGLIKSSMIELKLEESQREDSSKKL
ncbi:uncharacterized protein [Lolium perenne]|uniref:uncharacterized protein isoform X2 n=1 Tax=Lolium perenne TaxID=4522 RepID=UPI0021F4FE2F|nr:uncharacterized protein LOC127333562 isoform X2 [Lolium perenne]